jgi:hypothetical protein
MLLTLLELCSYTRNVKRCKRELCLYSWKFESKQRHAEIAWAHVKH